LDKVTFGVGDDPW